MKNIMTKVCFPKKSNLLCLLIFSFTLLVGNVGYTQTTSYFSRTDEPVRIDYDLLYDVDYDKEEGIDGTIPATSGGKIDVFIYNYDPTSPGSKGIELYHVWIDQSTNVGSYSEKHTPSVPIFGYEYLDGFSTASNNIKVRAQKAQVYVKGKCLSAPTWLRAVSDYYVRLVYNGCGEGFISKVQPVIVEVKTTNGATFRKAKVPGLGGLTIDGQGRVVRTPVATFYDYCAAESSPSSFCTLFKKVREPEANATEDVFIAAHRGWWGYDLGSGPPENTKLAVQSAAREGAQIVEMDLTITADNKLIFMHDYVMARLTDYTSNYPDYQYSFQLSWDKVKDKFVRRRDGSISDQHLSTFFEVLSEVQGKQMMMMVDIKEQQSDGTDPNCRANCDFQTPKSQKQSWSRIVSQCLRQAESIHAKKNLVIKTYYSPQDVYDYIGNQMNNVLWTPMIVPNNFKGADGKPSIKLMTDFIDAWNAESSGRLVACFETNFFAPDDIMLQPFTATDGTRYQNLLEYIYKKTGRRSGVFSEEPVGPRGTVNRWGKWKVKDPRQDIRGDFYQLINIPYGNKMLITTDRLDIWKQMKAIF